MNSLNFAKTEKAFTLAEVLITLAIIGMVAALTIPTLISNHKKAYTVNKIRKTIAVISQAIRLSIADGYENFDWDMSKINSGDLNTRLQYSKEVIAERLVPYLKVSQDCFKNPEVGCFAPQVYFLNGQPDGGNKKYDSNFYTLILEDGTSVAIFIDAADYIKVRFDVNGKKAPNVIGKDIFEVIFLSTGECLTITGSYNAERSTFFSGPYSCNKQAYLPGFACTNLIIKDGWKISDDYPW